MKKKQLKIIFYKVHIKKYNDSADLMKYLTRCP